MPELILIKAPGGVSSAQRFPLDQGDLFFLGRDQETCQIHLPNQTVSKKHAQIIRKGDQFTIEDLKSRNHTFVNNKETAGPTVLKHDDNVKICDFLFRFVDERKETKPRIPEEFLSNVEDDAEPEHTTFDFEHSFDRGKAEQFLDSQPAERLRALLDISSSLAKTLELDPLLPQITETLFNVFRQADRCFILLYDEGRKLVPKVARARRGTQDDMRFSKTIIRKCLDSMTAFLTADASSDSALGGAMSIAEFRIRSVMCVPLANSDGEPIGAIQLDTQERSRKFREDDLKLLTIVGNFASVAVEKASFHARVLQQMKQEKEIEIARDVQFGFLPQVLPEVSSYEFFASYSPAQSVGGDYYDFIPLSGGRYAIVLGDVAGKGVPASLLMAKLSAEARFCILTQPDIAQAVCLLNEQLIRGGIGDRFVTFAALVLDPDDHSVSLVNAGHLNPMRYRAADKSFVEMISNAQSGVPLGLMSGYPYEAIRFSLDIGDSLVLFTDGVTDAAAPDGRLFGMDGIVKAVTTEPAGMVGPSTPKRVGERLMKAVRNHAQGKAQSDDIAIATFGRVDPVLMSGAATAPMASGTSLQQALKV